MSSAYGSMGLVTFAEKIGSPYRAARSTDSRLVALPCQTRMGCWSGRGQTSASVSDGRNAPDQVTVSSRQSRRNSS